MNAQTTQSTAKELPGTSGWPLVGHIPDISRKGLFEMIASHRETLGDIFRFRLGKKEMVVLIHPEHIKHTYLTHRDNYRKDEAYDNIRILVGDGLLTVQDEQWRHRRRTMQPAFHRDSIIAMTEEMKDATLDLLKEWEPRFKADQSVDIYSEMMHVTLDIIGRTLFNLRLNDKADRSAEAFSIALEHISERGNNLFNLPLSVPTPSNIRFRRSIELLDKLGYDIIEDRRKNDKEHHDLLEMLLKATDEHGELLTQKTIRDELVTMFLAGHETTAIALSWTWYLLSQHPEVEAKLHEEWEEVLQGRPATADDLPNLPYSKMVFQEAMRLYSPVWSGGRNAVADDMIDGYHINAGSIVVICPYFTHRHPDFWEDPERFWPERFSPENSKGRHKFAYVPFSVGPRMCIGNHFSTFEAQILLPTIGQKYRFALDPTHKVEKNFQITLRPKHGLYMFPHART